MNYKKFMSISQIMSTRLRILCVIFLMTFGTMCIFAQENTVVDNPTETSITTTVTTCIPVTSVVATTNTTTITTSFTETTTEETTTEVAYEIPVVEESSSSEEEEFTYIEESESSDDIDNENNEAENYQGTFEATYYEGGSGTYGASGRDLISGYSIASNIFPQGSLIRIEGSGLDGIYRVDDRGGMADNILDFYYQYGDTPSDFQYCGRMNVQVYLIG